MDDILPFAVTIGVVCGVLLLAVVSNRIGDRVGVPAPAFFLVAAAIATDLVPRLTPHSIESVQRIVTVALIAILFNGGLDMGWPRFRANVGAIAWLGVVGTFVTAGARRPGRRTCCSGSTGRSPCSSGRRWPRPTPPWSSPCSDAGRSPAAAGTLLEGESGANDPVGIALMVALLTAATSAGGGARAHRRRGVRAADGRRGASSACWAGGCMVAALRLSLPSEGLYVIRSDRARRADLRASRPWPRGSGFLAVFLAGMVVADARAPYKREVERFHTAAASLGEIVAFTVLGLTINLRTRRGHAARGRSASGSP